MTGGGWRPAAKAARRVGCEVNDKWIRRLRRDEGLRVPHKTRKQPLRGMGGPVGSDIQKNVRELNHKELSITQYVRVKG